MAHLRLVERIDGAAAKWSYRRIPAVRELLDLIAVELAKEYVGLMARGGAEASTNAAAGARGRKG